MKSDTFAPPALVITPPRAAARGEERRITRQCTCRPASRPAGDCQPLCRRGIVAEGWFRLHLAHCQPPREGCAHAYIQCHRGTRPRNGPSRWIGTWLAGRPQPRCLCGGTGGQPPRGHRDASRRRRSGAPVGVYWAQDYSGCVALGVCSSSKTARGRRAPREARLS